MGFAQVLLARATDACNVRTAVSIEQEGAQARRQTAAAAASRRQPCRCLPATLLSGAQPPPLCIPAGPAIMVNSCAGKVGTFSCWLAWHAVFWPAPCAVVAALAALARCRQPLPALFTPPCRRQTLPHAPTTPCNRWATPLRRLLCAPASRWCHTV